LKIYKKEVLILKIINEYSFKEGLTKKELEYAGFTNFSQSFYFYTRTLISGVSLKISIPVNENGDLCLDQSDIIVEDDIFMQPYLLFYDAINSKYGVRLNGSARKLIDEYNKKMDVLEQKGVLVKIKDRQIENDDFIEENIPGYSLISVDCAHNYSFDINNGGPKILGFDFIVKKEDSDELKKFIWLTLENLGVPLLNLSISDYEHEVENDEIFDKKRIFACIAREAEHINEVVNHTRVHARKFC